MPTILKYWRERTGKNQLVGKLKNEELYLFSLSHYCDFFCFGGGGGHYFVFFLVGSLLWWFLFSVFSTAPHWFSTEFLGLTVFLFAGR